MSDPLGEAIVAQGITDQPLEQTSHPASHTTERSSDIEKQSPDKTPARSSIGDESGDTDDFVVFDSKDEIKRVGQTSQDKSPGPVPGTLAGYPPSSPNRASIESVSFGFRDNLLPLAPSGNEDEDDDDYDDDYEGGQYRSPGQYGEAERTAGPANASGTRRRRRRYKDPEKRMGLIDGIALTVGLQIGSGIFSSPGVVTLNTGSIGASLLVWIFSGVLAWTGASSFAELGAAIPETGGAQAYLNYSLGSLLSYLFSWTAIVALKPGSGAIIAIIFGEYLARVLFHATSTNAEGHPHEQGLDGIPQWSIKLIACLVIILISAVNAFSAKLGTRLQVGTTLVKLVALIAVPILAIVFAATGKMPIESKTAFSSFSNLFANSSTSPSAYALALYSGLWAYDGWDQSCYVAGEMKNTARDLPRVIHASMSIVVIFFCLTVLSYFLILTPDIVKGTNTVALDFGSAIFGTTGGLIFALLVSFSCFGALNSQVYTSSRLVFAAGKEGYLPSLFGKINGRTATPVAATIFQAALVLVFILFGSGFASLVSFYGVCSYTWYFLTVFGLLVLRIKEPNLNRPYKTWIPTPVLFATTALFLLVMPIASAPQEAAAAIAFMLAGLPAYFLSMKSAREGVVEKYVPKRVRDCCGTWKRRDDSKSIGPEGRDQAEEEDEGEEAMEMLTRPSEDTVRYSTSSKGKGRAYDEPDGDQPESEIDSRRS